MNITQIENTTRVLGEEQGYLPLPIRDVVYDDGTPAMQSAWIPTEVEIAYLIGGGQIIMTVLGNAHPPVNLEVQCPT